MMDVEELIELLEKVQRKEAAVMNGMGEYIDEVEVRHRLGDDKVIVVLRSRS